MEIENMTPSLEDVLEKSLEEVHNLTPDNPEAYELAVKNLEILYQLKREQEKAEQEQIERKKQRRLDWANFGVNCLKAVGVIGLTVWQFVKTDFWKKAALLFEEKGSFTPPTRELMREKFPDIKF